MPRHRLSQLVRLFRRRRQDAHQDARRSAKRRRTLQVEALEDRVLLAVRVWDGGGSTANWSDAANWIGDVAPLTNDELVFADGAAQLSNINDLPDGTFITSITFTGGGYSITGANQLIVTGGITSNTPAGDNALTAPLRILNNQSIASANAGSTLALGDVDTGSLFTITFLGDGNVVVGGDLSGTGGVTKQGTGTLVLEGDNSYQGATLVNQGVLNIRSATALGADTAPTVVAAGAALEIEGGVGGIDVGMESLQLAGRGIGGPNDDFGSTGALRSTSGDNTWAGNIAISGTVVVGVDGGSLDLSGVVSGTSLGANSLAKAGAGTLIFSGGDSNTYAGDTNVNEGELVLGKTGGAVAIAGNLIIGDHLGGAGADVVRLTQPDQIAHLDLAGLQNRTVVIRSTGQLDLGAHNETVGPVTFERAAGASGSIVGTGMLTLEGNLTINSTLQGTSGLTPAVLISTNVDLGTRSRTFTVNETDLVNGAQAAPDLVVSGGISGGADVHLIKAGGGYLSLLGDNAFLGDFYAAGFLGIGSDTALGAGDVSLNATVFAEGATRTVANDITLDGTLSVAGTNHLAFTGAANLTGNRTIRILEPGQVTEFAGGIGEQMGSRSLVVDGLGTVVLSGVNVFSGALTVGGNSILSTLSSNQNLTTVLRGGTLILRGDGSIRDVTGITVNQDASLVLDNSLVNLTDRVGDATIALNSGTLDFLGMAGVHSSEIVGTIDSNVGHNLIRLTPGLGGTVELNPNSLTADAIAALEFTAVGTDLGSPEARLRFLSTPTFSNNVINRTFISHSGGADLATYDAVAGVTPFTEYWIDPVDLSAVPATANVLLTSSRVLTGNASFSSLTLRGAGVNLDINGFTLQVATGRILDDGGNSIVDSMGGGQLTTAGGVHFNITTLAGTSTIGAVVASSVSGTTNGGLTKTGDGVLVLSAANTYPGTTDIGRGVLRITNAGALGDLTNGTTIRDGASLELLGVDVVGENLTSDLGGGPAGGGSLRSVGGVDSSWSGNVALGSNVVTFGTDAGTQLTISGAITGNNNIIKVGQGTLHYTGTAANTSTGTTFVNEGVLRLNKTAAVNAIAGAVVIGDDAGAAGSAVLRLEADNQIAAVQITVNTDGRLDLNGFSDVVAAVHLRSGVGQAGEVAGPGTLTPTEIRVQALPGADTTVVISSDITLTGNRTFNINDTLADVDLEVTGAIGQDASARALTKAGMGTLLFSGATANTYTGNTTINEGVLRLGKTAGVAALGSGTITVGDNLFASEADRLELAADEQLPDGINVVVNSSGRFDLMGFDETIGAMTVTAGKVTAGDGDMTLTSAAATVLTMSGGLVDMGAGVLTVSGNIQFNSVPLMSTIAGNLDLGGATRTFTVANSPTAIDAMVSADITNGAVLFTGAGDLLLSGDNDFAGGLTQTASGTNLSNFLYLGSDTALGVGVYTMNPNGSGRAQVSAFGGPRTIANELALNTDFVSPTLNDLTFTDTTDIQLVANRTFNVVNAGAVVTLASPITQDATNRNLTKSGRGTLLLQGDNAYAGATTISANGGVLVLEGASASTGTTTVGDFGTLLLRGMGQLDGIGALIVNFGGTLQIDNTGVSDADRLPAVTHTLNFGRIEFQANAAGSSEEIGALSIQSDFDSSVHLVNVGPGVSTFTAASLTFDAGSSLLFRGTGEELGGGTNDFIFTAAPTLTGSGILNHTRIIDASGLDFATHAGAGTPITAAAFSNDINAGGNVKLTGAGGENAVLGGSVSIDALLLAEGVNITEVGGPHSLTVTGGFVGVENGDSTISVGTLEFAGARSVFVVNGSLTADAVINSTNTEALTKTGLGLMALEQANTFTGRVRVAQGGLVVRDDAALGTAAGNTNTETLISNRAFLLLDGPRTLGDERITITGTGFYNDQSGALRATGGASSIGVGTTIFARGNASFLGVEGGSDLIINGELQGGGNALTKVGEGAVEFTGTTQTNYTGATNVSQGVLRLNKIGVNAIRGTLNVGDGLGGDDADLVVSMAADQILDTVTVTVEASGRLELQNEAFATLNIRSGARNSGDVLLGASTLGLSGNIVNTTPLGGTTTSSPAATISGGTIDFGATPRIIDVADSAAVRELEITAAVTGVSVQKNGTGGLALLADNATAGLAAFILNGGTIIVGHDGALGSGTLTNSASAAIQGDDDATLRTLANPIIFTSGSATTLTIGGFQGMAPLSFTGSLTNTGNNNRTFTLQNSSTTFSGDLNNNARALTFNTAGSITTPAQNTTTFHGQMQNLTTLTKSGFGTLISTNVNAQTGATLITQGVLRIADSGGLGAADGDVGTRTNISANASLELDNVVIGDELLVINATTAYLDGDELAIPGTQILRGIGSLRNVGGVSTWGTGATRVFLGANPSDIFVAGGSMLTLSADLIGSGTITPTPATSGANGLEKLGDGELVLGGTTANHFTGQTSVLEGTLTLSKAPGDNALGGTLLVGDGLGADILRWNASEQLPNVAIIAHHSGMLDLNGQMETVTTSPVFGIGPNSSASVVGGGQLQAAAIFIAVDRRATAASAPVLFSADYNFGAVAANTNREFRVPDGPAAEEFVIDGAISGSFATGGRGLIKSGYGALRFTGAAPHTYAAGTTGITNVTGGTLVLDKGDSILAVPGTLTVGNGIGEQDMDRVVSLFHDQIAGVNTTTINASGLLDLTNVNNTIGTMTIVAGLRAGGRIVTGGGTLVSGNTITVNVLGTGETSARIEGQVDLGGGARTFTVNTRQATLDTPDEFQVLNLAGATGGTYTLTFRGHTTTDIAFDAPATGGGSVEAALRALQTITGTNISVQNPSPGVYYLFFRDALGKFNVDQIEIDAALLTGTVGPAVVTTRHHGFETTELDMPAILSNGSLTKGGAGAMRLSGANVHTATTLSAGFLALGADSNLPTSSPVGLGVLTLGGGQLRADGGDRMLENSITPSGGTLQFSGGNDITLSPAVFQFTGNRTFFVANEELTVTVATPITQNSGSRVLTKTGAGTLLLNAVNTYAGATNVNAGTLGGTGRVAALNIDNLATAAPFANPSNLSPGVSPGIFSSGNVTFNVNSSFTVELTGPVGPGSPVAGVDYDQLDVTGTVNLGAGSLAELVLNIAPTFTPAPFSRFAIINNDGADAVNNTFVGLPDGAMFVVADRLFRIDYDLDAVTGLAGNDVVLTLLPPNAVYVDDTWTGTAPGDDPEPGLGLPLVFNYNAFDNLPDALAFVADSGDVIVYGGSYAAALDINKDATFQTRTNPFVPGDTLVDITGAVTLTNSATFNMDDADLRFGASIDAAAAGVQTLTVNGDDVLTIAGSIGSLAALGQLQTDAGGVTRIDAASVVADVQSYGDAVVIMTDAALTAAVSVDFAATVNSETLEANDLQINSPSTTFSGEVGQAVDGALGLLQTDAAGTTVINTGLATAAELNFLDALVAAVDATLTGTTSSAFAAIDSEALEANDLSIFTGAAVFGAAVGGAPDGQLGMFSVTTSQALTFGVGALADSHITFTVIDAAGPGQNLAINSPAGITSSGGDVTFNVGDDATIQAGATINVPLGVMTINGDFGDADVGVGVTVDFAGALVSPNSSIINGGADNDVLFGSSSVDQINGLGGNDQIIGRQSGDDLNGGDGDDLIIWNNGDGSDVIDGGADSDTVEVNGSNASGDEFLISDPADGRLLFQRTNLGLFSLDIGTVETLDVNGLGGADIMQVQNLANVLDLTQVNLRGGDGEDHFTVNPSTNVGVDVLGGDPTAPAVPGDQLVYITPPGETNTLTPSGPFSGTISSTGGFLDVTYDEIESLAVTGDIVVNGTAGDDTLVVTATSADAGSYQLITDGVPGLVVNFTSATSLTFNGLDGDDILRINNPGGGLFDPVDGVVYDGGTGGEGNTPAMGDNPTGDGLEILGGMAATSVEHVFANNHDGSVRYDLEGTATITYT
ncbi:MAG: autotransporter-associated beta strand repeat-containing protein, partial [Pirellulaceae bacterium]